MLSKSRKVRKREEKNSCDRMHEEKVRSGAGVFHFSDTLWADLTEEFKMCREAQASPLHFQAVEEV